LHRIIGQGGMGTVYQASQTAPISRDVAIKFVKGSAMGEAGVRRFKLECQALALMNHENIARIYDVDTTGDGQPFFVMEYVQGVRIDTFCDEGKLDVSARLRLFLQVCGAIQHAHQKGVIHRDIKPSNILVGELASGVQVKVIDFGVVKSLDGSLSEESVHTELGRLMGTPHYMSPEQLAAGNSDVDTRSDVYALGVLLYELLTGTLPFNARFENIYQLIVHVRQNDPSRASLRVQKSGEEGRAAEERAAERNSSPTTLAARLRGDLDWILTRALAREREERYPTVAALAEDLNRHLEDRPVLAAKPSARYLLAKWVRRNRLLFASVCAISFTLLLAAILTTSALLRARQSAREAEKQRAAAVEALQISQKATARADHVNRFLTQMLAAADPGEKGREVRVIDVLEQAGEQAKTAFPEDPQSQVAVHRAIAQAYLGLGHYDAAELQVRLALARAEAELGDTHEETLATKQDLAMVFFSHGQYPQSEELYRSLLSAWNSRPGNHQETTLQLLNDLGMVIKFQGRLSEAIPLYRQALNGHRRLFGENDARTIESMNNLAMALKRPEELAEAEELMRLVFSRVRAVKGEMHPWTLSTLNNLGHLLLLRHDPREAILFHREALRRRSEVLGAEHPQTFQSKDALARLLLLTGQTEQATTYAREALEGYLQVLRPGHLETLRCLRTNLHCALVGQPQRARQLLASHAAAIKTLPAAESNLRLAFHLDSAQAELLLGFPQAAAQALAAAQAEMGTLPGQTSGAQAYDLCSRWLAMEINGDPLLWRDLATTIERLLADPTARIEHWVMIRCLCERVRIWGHGQEAEAWIYQLKDAWPAARGESFDHHSAQELP
jgi:serine/threonine protein kinase